MSVSEAVGLVHFYISVAQHPVKTASIKCEQPGKKSKPKWSSHWPIV